MINAIVARWLIAFLIALVVGAAAVPGDFEDLQATADAKAEAIADAPRSTLHATAEDAP